MTQRPEAVFCPALTLGREKASSRPQGICRAMGNPHLMTLCDEVASESPWLGGAAQVSAEVY